MLLNFILEILFFFMMMGFYLGFLIDKSVKYFLYVLILILKKINVYFYIFSFIFYFDLLFSVDGIFDL